MGKDYFDYEVREEDSSLKVVRERENFFGFCESKPLDYDDDYLYLGDAILDDEDIAKFSRFKLERVSKEYLKDSLQIYDELGIGLHNVNLIAKKFGARDEIKDMTELWKFISAVSPSKIPIHLSAQRSGCISWYGIHNKVKRILAFKDICLPRFGNKTTACFYLHEIAHTQIMGVNRGVKNALNEEMIPNFIDQIAAMKVDSTGAILRDLRYSNALLLIANLDIVYSNPNLEFDSRLECDTFVQSVLEATNLANVYFEASPLVKREILGDVNKVFNGDMFTEEMLSKYESGVDAVPKDVKVFKKI